MKVSPRRPWRASARAKAAGVRWSRLPPNATVAPSGMRAAAVARSSSLPVAASVVPALVIGRLQLLALVRRGVGAGGLRGLQRLLLELLRARLRRLMLAGGRGRARGGRAARGAHPGVELAQALAEPLAVAAQRHDRAPAVGRAHADLADDRGQAALGPAHQPHGVRHAAGPRAVALLLEEGQRRGENLLCR